MLTVQKAADRKGLEDWTNWFSLVLLALTDSDVSDHLRDWKTRWSKEETNHWFPSPFFSKSRNYFLLTSENLKKLTQIPRIMDVSQNSGTLLLDQKNLGEVLWTWNNSESLAACEL